MRLGWRGDICYDSISYSDRKSIERSEQKIGLFKLTDESGQVWSTRQVALATSVEDIFPDIEGYQDC